MTIPSFESRSVARTAAPPYPAPRHLLSRTHPPRSRDLGASLPRNLPSTRPGRRRPFVSALIASIAAVILGCGKPSPPPNVGDVQVSLLAVGDTGLPSNWRPFFDRQEAVAEGLAAEDHRRAADALVLLGDNFYKGGLYSRELVPRLRDVVVRPYCHFVELAGPDSASVADACSLRPAERHAIPIYVVLGNHDYASPKGPALEAEAIPRFVSNWRLAKGAAEALELGHGLSLILFQSERFGDRDNPDMASLRDAIRGSRGPWRILATHHPIATHRGGSRESKEDKTYRKNVLRALRESGKPVQLFLSGHEHNLQVLEEDPPAPPLHVVTGSGSRIAAIGPVNSHRLFSRAEPGFVRIDLVNGPGEARLVVSVFTVEPILLLPGRGPILVARWSVNRRGEIHEMETASASPSIAASAMLKQRVNPIFATIRMFSAFGGRNRR
jgi:3',5'-cyclic AMP phosphodiesterase CpdA